MRDKLIAILSSVPPGHVGNGPTDEEIADTVLASLRCDKCQNFSVNRLRSTGLCMENQDLITREVEPDFFCALWEPKA